MNVKLVPAQKGFTLIEIMIVVTLMAMLVAIAVPNFLRARQRAQASAIMDEMRILTAAIDQTALEKSIGGNDPVVWEEVNAHLKPGSRLAEAGDAVDLLGNPILLGNYNEVPKINEATIANFDEDVVPRSFWKIYAEEE